MDVRAWGTGLGGEGRAIVVRAGYLRAVLGFSQSSRRGSYPLTHPSIHPFIHPPTPSIYSTLTLMHSFTHLPKLLSTQEHLTKGLKCQLKEFGNSLEGMGSHRSLLVLE